MKGDFSSVYIMEVRDMKMQLNKTKEADAWKRRILKRGAGS